MAYSPSGRATLQSLTVWIWLISTHISTYAAKYDKDSYTVIGEIDEIFHDENEKNYQ